MSALRRIAGVSGLLALMAAMPAAARITPEQAWDIWRELAQSSGQPVTITTSGQNRSGDRLVIEGVTATFSQPNIEARAPLGQIVLRDRGDGTVEATFAPRVDITVNVSEPDSEPVALSLSVTQENYVTIISGTPEAPVFDVSADAVAVSQNAPLVNGAAIPMELNISLAALQGRVAITGSGRRDFTYDFTADSAEANMAATNPKNGGTIESNFSFADLAAEFSGSLPDRAVQSTELRQLIDAGLQFGGSYGTGPAEFTVTISENDLETNVTGSLGETGLRLALGPTGLDYDVSASAIDIAAEGGQVPFPDFRVTAESYRLGLALPLLRSKAPSDFRFALGLVGLVLPDAVWGMLDPGATLPRDPATLVLDTTGKVRLLQDLTTPPGDDSRDIPGELHALTIKDLQLKAVGAALTGSGDFTFDNSDTQTFGGMPRPAGRADLSLAGGNALLDRLIALGVVPQDQAMGFRMMLALFARPGAGPDTLTSTVEITPEGQILANGQRIQ